MTSSLVGSEMCIRDRATSAQLTPWKSIDEFLLPAPDDTFPKVRALLSPVSYTHLTLPTICSV
eukprot:6485814-Prorocentrum_lima.AAC.1